MSATDRRPSGKDQAGPTPIAVLQRELRLVEEVDERVVDRRALHEEGCLEAAEMPHLISLVVMDGEPVALAGAHVVDVQPAHRTCPSVGWLPPVMSCNLVRLPKRLPAG